ncbi:MAG: PQQ-binding-like beta-propeller repeat protein [Planctomycetota bacterium]
MTRIRFRWLLCSVCLLPLLAARAAATAPPGSESNWHQWRGPTSTGQAAPTARPPREWSETQNVAWKLDLPGEGSSTPIIWGDQVFVLSALATDRPAETPIAPHADAKTLPPNVYHRFLVTAVDRSSGQIRWQKLAAEELPHEGKHSTHTYAAASPVTDGQRLYASFGSRGIYCYTLDGSLLWSKDLGDMRTRFAWGEAVTPALAGELLIVNWDQEEHSFIVALRADTGEEIWRKDRPGEKTSWNTPLITEVDSRQVAVVNGSGKARAYDVSTGDVLWECGGQTTNAIPSPLRFEDLAICVSGYRGAASFAIPLKSRGDITGSDGIRWSYSEGTPYVPSPSSSGNRLYFTGGLGDILTVLDMSTGKPIRDRLRLNGVGNCYASPLIADGRVYIIGREGGAVVLQDAAPFATLASSRLEGNFDASPVAVGNQLFLRSWNRLYCIAE